MYLEEQKLFNCLSQVVIFFKVWLHQYIECCNYCSVCRRLQHSAGARKNRPQGGNLFSINRTTMFPNLRHYDKKHELLHISKIDPTSEGLKNAEDLLFPAAVNAPYTLGLASYDSLTGSLLGNIQVKELDPFDFHC